MKKTYKSEATAAVYEMMSGFYKAGAISESAMREFDELCLTPVEMPSPEEIKAIREQACATVDSFARHLNVSPRLVSQWESGRSRPNGPALKLLTLVKRKGLSCIA